MIAVSKSVKIYCAIEDSVDPEWKVTKLENQPDLDRYCFQKDFLKIKCAYCICWIKYCYS